MYSVISEYEDMMTSLRNQGKWRVIDCLQENHAKIDQIATFIKHNERTEVLEEKERLDYVLYINPNCA